MPDVQSQLWQAWDMLMQFMKDNRGCYAEAKVWLLQSLAATQGLTPTEQLCILRPLLLPDPESPHGGQTQQSQLDEREAVPHALLALFCKQRAPQALAMICRQKGAMRDFFSGSQRRIRLWFSHFSMDGMSHFKYGARALATYALANRNEVWQLLRWEGKHAQAPVSVANKTYYFCELDVVATVQAFADECPDFWQSDAFLACINQPELLQVDPDWFVQELAALIRSQHRPAHSGSSSGGRSGSGMSAVEDWLRHESWPLVVQRVGHMLDDSTLLQVLQSAGVAWALTGPTSGGTRPGSNPSASLLPAPAADAALALAGGMQWASVPQVVLAHALTCHRQPLLSQLTGETDGAACLTLLQRMADSLYYPFTRHAETEAALQPWLRRPRSSRSTRQLLAVHNWLAWLAWQQHALEMASPCSAINEDLPPSQLVAAGAHLVRHLQSLGWQCHWEVDAAMAAPLDETADSQHMSMTTGDAAYALLPSSDEEDGQRRKRHKKGMRRHKRTAKHQAGPRLPPTGLGDSPTHGPAAVSLGTTLVMTAARNHAMAGFVSSSPWAVARPGGGPELVATAMTGRHALQVLAQWLLACSIQRCESAG